MNDRGCTLSKPNVLVLEERADAEGVSPVDLESPLDDVVDTAALDQLLETTAIDHSIRGGHVSFSYRGYDVTITSNDTIVIDPTV